jgi:hypothetical protein
MMDGARLERRMDASDDKQSTNQLHDGFLSTAYARCVSFISTFLISLIHSGVRWERTEDNNDYDNKENCNI